jgi:hypothetical protein
MAWTGDTYRQACVEYILKNNIFVPGKANYQFGIYSGTTLKFIYYLFLKYDIPCQKILAFDSFEGLPEEARGIEKSDEWDKGVYSMKAMFQQDDPQKIIDKIMERVSIHDDALESTRKIPIEWHVGFFADVLNADFMAGGPLPAFWVDLDVDMYISAVQVLDFMLKNQLIQVDTVLSFDDWGGTEEYRGGESLAFKEMCEKYKMFAECFHTYEGVDKRDANRHHCQKAFIVRSIG